MAVVIWLLSYCSLHMAVVILQSAYVCCHMAVVILQSAEWQSSLLWALKKCFQLEELFEFSTCWTEEHTATLCRELFVRWTQNTERVKLEGSLRRKKVQHCSQWPQALCHDVVYSWQVLWSAFCMGDLWRWVRENSCYWCVVSAYENTVQLKTINWSNGQLTNSLEQSPCWEANSSSLTQENPSTVWNPKWRHSV
jgi:hypothetical protein